MRASQARLLECLSVQRLWIVVHQSLNVQELYACRVGESRCRVVTFGDIQETRHRYAVAAGGSMKK